MVLNAKQSAGSLDLLRSDIAILLVLIEYCVLLVALCILL